MDITSLVSSVIWVDLVGIILSKYKVLGESLYQWYIQYGLTAVLSDCLVIILGILLTDILFPKSSLIQFILIALVIQLIHDYLFYIFVILKVNPGENSIIDLFKKYADAHGHNILIADSIMTLSTILIYTVLKRMNSQIVFFIGSLGAYAMTYIIYTK
jgi:hypothetical protein